MFSKYFLDPLTVICFESRSLQWQSETGKMHKSMPKIYKKSFENERKIERRSMLAEGERERTTFKRLSVSGAQNHTSER